MPYHGATCHRDNPTLARRRNLQPRKILMLNIAIATMSSQNLHFHNWPAWAWAWAFALHPGFTASAVSKFPSLESTRRCKSLAQQVCPLKFPLSCSGSRSLSNCSQHSSLERALSIVIRQVFPTNPDWVLELWLACEKAPSRSSLRFHATHTKWYRQWFCDPDHWVASKDVPGALASLNELLFLGQSFLIALRHLGKKLCRKFWGSCLPRPEPSKTTCCFTSPTPIPW